jgi:hypothetical protein
VVVIVASLSSAIGALISSVMTGNVGQVILASISSMVLSIVGFYLWVYVAHFIGTKLFKGTGEVGKVKRALGFSYAPHIYVRLK